jgi:ATP phosphoribosyltransferase
MITIALPSKGRMKEDASAVLERAGLKVAAVGNDRSYRGRIEGRDDIEIAYLSASEIAREIGAGTVDFGVTGEDLVREGLTNADAQVEFCASALVMRMSLSPCRKSGWMWTAWPISAMSLRNSAPVMAAGSPSPPNIGG